MATPEEQWQQKYVTNQTAAEDKMTHKQKFKLMHSTRNKNKVQILSLNNLKILNPRNIKITKAAEASKGQRSLPLQGTYLSCIHQH